MNKTKTYLVGFFHVNSVGAVSVETPLTGDGAVDYATLWELIRKKYPKAKKEDITRTGSTIETRLEELKLISYPVGTVIKQLFATETAGEEECAIRIGTVNFNSEPCEVVLRYHRAKNVIGVTLRERATGVPIRFSEQVTAMRLARETPKIVSEILGNQATNLQLNLAEIGEA